MNFLKKIFGVGKSTEGEQNLKSAVEETLEQLISKGGFHLTYEVDIQKDSDGISLISIELQGEDEGLLKEKNGQVIDAIQLLVKRILQHNFPNEKTSVRVDCGGYREESEAALIERAENLKKIVIEQGRSVYYRVLPPKDRKIVHQYLAQDPRVKSRSLGDGHYKKIKIYPVRQEE
ncbi:MAG: hypothetical protein N2578_00545 [Bdellovibrionaceae bacterium]|nr:hypothetical protein [Pseudobdellovibrionaceae bacterium]